MSSVFDTAQVRRAFGRAAPDYSAVAALQREVQSRLLEQLDYVQATPTRVLDLGCGPGGASFAMRQRWPQVQMIGVDFALPMLQQAGRGFSWWPRSRRRFDRVCADVTRLPLVDGCADVIFSSLCLQWVEDLPATLAGFRRLLRPDGLLLFSTFGSDTLTELRQAFAAVDDAPHVSGFPPVQHVGDSLLRAGFRDPVVDVDRFTLTYQEPRALMRELRAIGAGNAHEGRRRSLTGKARMQQVFDAYECFRVEGRLPASYEVVYAQARAPQPGQPEREGEGELARFPIDALKIRRRA
jgi:malonyl-CoA O-methyltransferase